MLKAYLHNKHIKGTGMGWGKLEMGMRGLGGYGWQNCVR